MKKIAAYCRASTNSEDQLNSLASQRLFFERYINCRDDWTLTRIYADEGESGTATKKRRAFNRMIADAEFGCFELIVTKEISRFARNTLDSIYYTRLLKALGIGVIFLNDNINTLDPDSELRLTIMSSIAQEESRKTSERVKWGQKRQMERGVVFGSTVLGYSISRGRLSIDPIEADSVRKIFHKYVFEGKGFNHIARELEREGVLTAYKNARWSADAVRRIIKNEKYCGDLVQRKYYTPDYLTHAKKRNNGDEQLIILRDNHEPIIPRELFDRAQAEIVRRRSVTVAGSCYSNRYAFSGRLLCGRCGAPFICRTKSDTGKQAVRRWQCAGYFKYGHSHIADTGVVIGCENTMVRNELLAQVFLTALNEINNYKEEIIRGCMHAVEKTLKTLASSRDEHTVLLNRLAAKKRRAVELFLDGTITKTELDAVTHTISMQCEIAGGSDTDTVTAADYASPADRSDDIRRTVAALTHAELFCDAIVKHTLAKIIIHGNNRFVVVFKGVDRRVSLFPDD